MKIDHEESLKVAFQNGVNVFAGAGFSTLAFDSSGKKLPLGSELAKELSNKFLNYEVTDLTRISTILKSRHLEDFNDYLIERFSVKSFDERYENLNRINIHTYFTTNIDDLIPQIIEKHPDAYLNNLKSEGIMPGSKVINYLPLHGFVRNRDRNFDFTLTEISTTAQKNPRDWMYLMQSVEKRQTIFLGYGLNDASTLGSLYSKDSFQDIVKEKWILLKDPSKEDIDYFKSLNFSIIEGSIEDFLDYLPKLSQSKRIPKGNLDAVYSSFENNMVPNDLKGLQIRPIADFFKGDTPIWSDILSKNIYQTSHVDTILNSMNSTDRHTLIIGSPLCGKSTAVMQSIYRYSQPQTAKLYFSHLTIEKAQYIKKIIGGSKAIIYVEGFTDDVDAFLLLACVPNIKMIGVDRSHMYGIVSDLFDRKRFDTINVTEIKEQDLTGVYKSLPKIIRNHELKLGAKKKYYRSDTIFEFVSKNINEPTISQRYRDFLAKSEYDQTLFLVLCAYMHFCRVPLSIEVASSFFDFDSGFREVLELKKELEDLLSDLTGEDYDDMDYYYPRSQHVAESILKYVQPSYVREVVRGVLERVPKYQIPHYRVFKRYAYDSKFISRYFNKIKEGRDIYVKAYELDDRNPYVLQQGALYLAEKGEYEEAFSWIDRAKTATGNKHFSIRNTHAIILFEANIKGAHSNQKPLDESMQILKKCYSADRRKSFHALVFARQAMEYYKLYPSPKTMEYLNLAKQWIKEESKQNPWSWDIKNTLSDLNQYMANITLTV